MLWLLYSHQKKARQSKLDRCQDFTKTLKNIIYILYNIIYQKLSYHRNVKTSVSPHTKKRIANNRNPLQQLLLQQRFIGKDTGKYSLVFSCSGSERRLICCSLPLSLQYQHGNEWLHSHVVAYCIEGISMIWNLMGHYSTGWSEENLHPCPKNNLTATKLDPNTSNHYVWSTHILYWKPEWSSKYADRLKILKKSTLEVSTRVVYITWPPKLTKSPEVAQLIA